MKPQGWIAFIILFAVWFYFADYLLKKFPLGPEARGGFIFLMSLPFLTIISAVIYWKYFITADFFEMPPIRYTREFWVWLMAKMRGEKRLWLMPPKNIRIPPPLGDDTLRDAHLESLILEKAIPDAEEYVREKLDWSRLVSGEEGERMLKIYLHYMNFLIRFQRELEQ